MWVKRTKLKNHYEKSQRWYDGWLILPDPLDPPKLPKMDTKIGTWIGDGQVWSLADNSYRDVNMVGKLYWLALPAGQFTIVDQNNTVSSRRYSGDGRCVTNI
jgi:hypothetical protein